MQTERRKPYGTGKETGNCAHAVRGDSPANLAPHSSLEGLCPQERFFSEPERIRRLSQERLERSFLLEIERRVSPDCVVSIGRVAYETTSRNAPLFPGYDRHFRCGARRLPDASADAQQKGKRRRKARETLSFRRRIVMDINARFGLEFNPFLKNSREKRIRKRSFVSITLPKPADSAS